MERELPKEEAMKTAIGYCIEHNILRGFLEINSSEVFNMLLTEWDTEEVNAAWFEKGIEKGREEGWLTLAQLLREGKTLDEAMGWLKEPLPKLG